MDAGAERREEDAVDALGVLDEKTAPVGQARMDAVAEEGVLGVFPKDGEERAAADAQEQRLVVAEQFRAEAQRVEARQDPERGEGRVVERALRQGGIALPAAF